jgi:hypothetical protein
MIEEHNTFNSETNMMLVITGTTETIYKSL